MQEEPEQMNLPFPDDEQKEFWFESLKSEE